MADPTSALYYDESASTPRLVSLCIRNQIVFVEGAGVRRSTPLATVHIGEPWEKTPRVIRFSDGARCEVVDPAALAAMIGDGGRPPAASTQWESVPRALSAVVAVVVLVAVALYYYGVPLAAGVIARQVPVSATAGISRDAIGALDGSTLQPSRLPASRQAELTRQFERTMGSSSSVPFTLLFRSSPTLGANALAVPSGTIVITDELVALARDDRELIGVLAHEAGHVERRHSIRLVLQNSGVALFTAWAVGDFSSILAVAPASLLQSKYSRDLEREADTFAADLMRARGMPPALLADLLERMEQSKEGEAEGKPSAPSLLDYVSSHPATSERLEYLRSR